MDMETQDFNRHQRNKTRRMPSRPASKPVPKAIPEKEVDLNHFFEFENQTEHQVIDEELNFKPLNSGLGFHHKNSQLENQINFPKPTKGLWEKPKYFSFEEAKKKTFSDTALQPFYEPTHEEVFEKIFTASEKEVQLSSQKISKSEQLMAWSLDTAIVTALTLVNITLMFIASDISFSVGSIDFESGFLYGSLWCFWYVSYFTFFEYASMTIGKKLFNLELRTINQRSVSFSQSFLRSFFSLFSIMTLGLFSVLGGPSAASKTEVFRNEQ